MAFAITLHCLAAVIWVGGMFFAYLSLRPAANSLHHAIKLTLWRDVFKRFFPWVWLSIISLLLSGLWITIKELGGMAQVGVHVHIMLTLGLIMMLIFAHLYFSPFNKLKKAVAEHEWELAAKALNQIRQLILVNLSLGLLVVVIASFGQYL